MVAPCEGCNRESEARREGRAPPRLYFSFVFPLFLFLLVRNLLGAVFSFVFPSGGLGPYYDRLSRSVAREMVI